MDPLRRHDCDLITACQGCRRICQEPEPSKANGVGAKARIDQLAGFWDLVNVHDIEIVERVQEGISNPAYRGGRMCYQFEETLHRYQNMVIDKMVGIDRIPPGDEEESVRMFRSNGSAEGT